MDVHLISWQQVLPGLRLACGVQAAVAFSAALQVDISGYVRGVTGGFQIVSADSTLTPATSAAPASPDT